MSKKLRILFLAVLTVVFAASSVFAAELAFTLIDGKTEWADPDSWMTNVEDNDGNTMTAGKLFDAYTNPENYNVDDDGNSLMYDDNGNYNADEYIGPDNTAETFNIVYNVIRKNFYPGGFDKYSALTGLPDEDGNPAEKTGFDSVTAFVSVETPINLTANDNVVYTIDTLTFDGHEEIARQRTATLDFKDHTFALPAKVELTRAASVVFNNVRRVNVAPQQDDTAVEAYVINLAVAEAGGDPEATEAVSNFTINSPIYFCEWFDKNDTETTADNTNSFTITNPGKGTVTLNGKVSNFSGKDGFTDTQDETDAQIVSSNRGAIVLGDVSLLKGDVAYSAGDDAGLTGAITLPAGELNGTDTRAVITLGTGATFRLSGDLKVDSKVADSTFIDYVDEPEAGTTSFTITGSGALTMNANSPAVANATPATRLTVDPLIKAATASTIKITGGVSVDFTGVAGAPYVLGTANTNDANAEDTFTVNVDNGAKFHKGTGTVYAKTDAAIEERAGESIIEACDTNESIGLIVDGTVTLKGAQKVYKMDGIGTINMDTSALLTLTGTENSDEDKGNTGNDYTKFTGTLVAGNVWLQDTRDPDEEEETPIFEYPFSKATSVTIENLRITGELTLKETPKGVANLWLRRAGNAAPTSTNASAYIGKLVFDAENYDPVVDTAYKFKRILDPVIIPSIKIDGTTGETADADYFGNAEVAMIDVTGSRVVVNNITYLADGGARQISRVLRVYADAAAADEARDVAELSGVQPKGVDPADEYADPYGELKILAGEGGNLASEDRSVRADSIYVGGIAQLTLEDGTAVGDNNVAVADGAFLEVSNGATLNGGLTLQAGSTFVTSVGDSNRGSAHVKDYAVKVTGALLATESVNLNVALEGDMPSENPRRDTYAVIGSENSDTRLGAYPAFNPFDFEADNYGGVVARINREYVYPSIGTPEFEDNADFESVQQWLEQGKFRILIPVNSMTRTGGGVAVIDYRRFLEIDLDNDENATVERLVADGSDKNTYRVVDARLYPYNATTPTHVELWGDVETTLIDEATGAPDFTNAFKNGFEVRFTLAWDEDAEDEARELTPDDFLPRTFALKIPADINGKEKIKKAIDEKDQVSAAVVTPVKAYVEVAEDDEVAFTVEGLKEATDAAYEAELYNASGDYVPVTGLKVMLGEKELEDEDSIIEFNGEIATVTVSIDKLGFEGGVEKEVLYVRAANPGIRTHVATIWVSDISFDAPGEGDDVPLETTYNAAGEVNYTSTFNNEGFSGSADVQFVGEAPEGFKYDYNAEGGAIHINATGNTSEDVELPIKFFVKLADGTYKGYQWTVSAKAAETKVYEIKPAVGQLSTVLSVDEAASYALTLRIEPDPAPAEVVWTQDHVPAWLKAEIDGPTVTFAKDETVNEAVLPGAYAFIVGATVDGEAVKSVDVQITLLSEDETPPYGPNPPAGEATVTLVSPSSPVSVPAAGQTVTLQYRFSQAITPGYTLNWAVSSSNPNEASVTGVPNGDDYTVTVVVAPNTTTTAKSYTITATATVDGAGTTASATATINIAASSSSGGDEPGGDEPSGAATVTLVSPDSPVELDAAGGQVDLQFNFFQAITPGSYTLSWTATSSNPDEASVSGVANGDDYAVTVLVAPNTTTSEKSYTITATATVDGVGTTASARAVINVDAAAARRTGGGGGGGCDAGFGAFALMLAAPLFLRKRK